MLKGENGALVGVRKRSSEIREDPPEPRNAGLRDLLPVIFKLACGRSLFEGDKE